MSNTKHFSNNVTMEYSCRYKGGYLKHKIIHFQTINFPWLNLENINVSCPVLKKWRRTEDSLEKYRCSKIEKFLTD